MNKIPLTSLELTLYHETLDNGCEVYIVPKENTNNFYVTFTTKFGEAIKEFVPFKEKKMVKVQNGIAHFLEHKVFEVEKGEDPFTFFSKNGADTNASTDLDRTTYLFSGSSHFYENLNYLLDFVLTPYFTDENVEKEKEIIKEELLMYEDDPYSKIYERSLYNSFYVDPVKHYIGGTAESIEKITKEDLYTCFNTFYHPSNMFIVVTGNVDVSETILCIKENLKKKNYKNQEKITVKEYEEKDTVFLKEQTVYKNVVLPKVAVNVKVKIPNLKKYDLFDIKFVLMQMFNSKFSSTSSFIERLKEEGIIQQNLGFSLTKAKNHYLLTILGESTNPNVLIKEIKKELLIRKIDEEELERKKKVLISSYIYMSDNIYAINKKIMNNIIEYGEVIIDDVTKVRKFTLKKYEDIIEKLNFDNIATVTIMKEK